MAVERLALCRTEGAAGCTGEAARGQVEQYLLPGLYKLRQKITDRDIPSDRSQRYLTAFGYAFRVWGWHMEGLFRTFSCLHNTYQGCDTLIIERPTL